MRAMILATTLLLAACGGAPTPAAEADPAGAATPPEDAAVPPAEAGDPFSPDARPGAPDAGAPDPVDSGRDADPAPLPGDAPDACAVYAGPGFQCGVYAGCELPACPAGQLCGGKGDEFGGYPNQCGATCYGGDPGAFYCPPWAQWGLADKGCEYAWREGPDGGPEFRDGGRAGCELADSGEALCCP